MFGAIYCGVQCSDVKCNAYMTEAVAVEVTWHVAGTAGIGVLLPGAAQGGLLLQDGVPGQ